MDEDAQASFDRKIVKQIEYYFGDKNLPRDKFLLQKIEEDDGWVTLDCLLTFKRLKGVVYDAIANSLRSGGSGLLEVDESNTKFRRVKPLPDETEEALALAKEKTVYCKGFPEDATIDDIESFFEDKGKCIFIKMRRKIDDAKTFKGSVFAEFSTKEEADAFLAMEGLKYGDADLLYMSKDKYFHTKKESSGKANGDKNRSSEDTSVKEEKLKTLDYQSGCVVHFAGAGEQTSREDVKELFNDKDIEIAWVDFSRGDKEGYVRFKKAGDGQKAIDSVQDATTQKVTLRGVETTFRALEGEEEKAYWLKMDKGRENPKRKGWKKNFQHSRKRGRYGRGDGTDKQVSDSVTPAKQPKTET